MRIQYQLIVCVLTILSNNLVSTQIDLSVFREQALVAHNIIRDLYCLDDLVYNDTINDIAQNFATYLAIRGLFQHSGAPNLGENLFSLGSTNVITYINGSRPVNSWYSEYSRYNYSNPVYSAGTAHFTQLVWKSTTQFGIGVALSNNSQKVIVAANYYPPGNVQGAYVENVLEPCNNTIRGD